MTDKNIVEIINKLGGELKEDNTEYMNPKTSWDWFNRACTHDMISDFSHYRYSYKKGVVPTEEGLILYNHIESILNKIM